MSNDVIKVAGEDTVVRDDTAKAFRFVHWGVIVAGIGLAIMAAIAVFLYLTAASDGKLESPANFSNANRQQ